MEGGGDRLLTLSSSPSAGVRATPADGGATARRWDAIVHSLSASAGHYSDDRSTTSFAAVPELARRSKAGFGSRGSFQGSDFTLGGEVK